jgi:hypothetical protein
MTEDVGVGENNPLASKNLVSPGQKPLERKGWPILTFETKPREQKNERLDLVGHDQLADNLSDHPRELIAPRQLPPTRLTM